MGFWGYTMVKSRVSKRSYWFRQVVPIACEREWGRVRMDQCG